MTTPWSGKWALVTGASSGIGTSFARQLGAGGANLVLTARRAERLEQVAREIHEAYGSRIEIFPADLAQPEAPVQLFSFTEQKGLPIDVLINNAGFGASGEFWKEDLRRVRDLLQVNINAVVELSQLYAAPMVARGEGYILIVSSTAAFQPVGYLSAYSASKGFEMLFSGAIHEELREFGVHVTCLCPGATVTEWQQVAGLAPAQSGRAETPDKVARVGLAALARGKSLAISGLRNRLMMEAQRLVPRGLVARVTSRMYRNAAGQAAEHAAPSSSPAAPGEAPAEKPDGHR